MRQKKATKFKGQHQLDLVTGQQRYDAVAITMKDRIKKLIPEHLEILSIDNPFELFRIKLFKADDIIPSVGQALWALRMAKLEYREEQRGK